MIYICKWDFFTTILVTLIKVKLPPMRFRLNFAPTKSWELIIQSVTKKLISLIMLLIVIYEKFCCKLIWQMFSWIFFRGKAHYLSYHRNGWRTEVKLKGNTSNGCRDNSEISSPHLTHDMNLGFPKSNFEKATSQKHGAKGMRANARLTMWPCAMTWSWIFEVKFWKGRIRGMGRPFDKER